MKPRLATSGISAPNSVTLLLALAATATAQGAPGEATRQPETLADAFQRALLQMRADKAPGLVFVLPPADAMADPKELAALQKTLARATFGGESPVTLKTARDVMLWKVQSLRAALGGEVAALLVLTVQVVAEPSVGMAKDGETVVLLSPEGERVAGFAVDLADHAAVLDALAPHVLEREVVEPRRATVPPEAAGLVARRAELLQLAWERQPRGGLDAEEAQELYALEQELASRLTTVGPALVDFAGERASFGQDAHRLLYGQDVPLGTEVGEQWDPCPPCGMMAGTLAMRSTLKLLAK